MGISFFVNGGDLKICIPLFPLSNSCKILLSDRCHCVFTIHCISFSADFLYIFANWLVRFFFFFINLHNFQGLIQFFSVMNSCHKCVLINFVLLLLEKLGHIYIRLSFFLCKFLLNFIDSFPANFGYLQGLRQFLLLPNPY